MRLTIVSFLILVFTSIQPCIATHLFDKSINAYARSCKSKYVKESNRYNRHTSQAISFLLHTNYFVMRNFPTRPTS